ncbi:WxL domain-containing protein [Ligilactobacillus saerimneri]|uniref:WxL domain-containing protein n=1 Tax=Ligilactobacillus saerimneri TaxID=228229 RepID=UPI0024B0628A|nr:WxL domain-containing protein [Ligilactobacillus saerimneri]MDI9206141.1 WxL domain-containing protein [Ligilactobacillus saerimneri]
MKLTKQLSLATLATSCLLFGGSLTAHAADTTSQNSTATLNISQDDQSAKLSLDAVPSFAFGTVTADQVFNGGSVEQDLTTNNTVKITDTRLDQNGWNLAVSQTTAFTNGNSKIAGTMAVTPGTFSFNNGTATGANKGSASATISHAKFTFSSHDSLASGDYTANLTWNLTSAPNVDVSK